jgi:hypothetical protein
VTRILEALVIVAALVFGGLYVRDLFDDATTARADVAIAAELDSLRREAAERDTVYVLQRDTVWLQVATFDTLVQTVDRWKHDTVKVVKVIQQAQRTIQACQALVLSCEERVADRDAQLATWQRRWDSRAKPPSRLEEGLEAGLWLSAGWLLRSVVPR